MNWATPTTGLGGDPEWRRPIIRHWGKIKHGRTGEFTAAFPHIDTDDWANYKRNATFGFAQSKLTKIEPEHGFANGLKLHSFRGRAPTCANQLRFPREERGRLGHWAPGSNMPDRYDKATCAAELRLRGEILNKIWEGWRPQKAFEVEGGKPDRKATVRLRPRRRVDNK